MSRSLWTTVTATVLVAGLIPSDPRPASASARFAAGPGGQRFGYNPHGGGGHFGPGHSTGRAAKRSMFRRVFVSMPFGFGTGRRPNYGLQRGRGPGAARYNHPSRIFRSAFRSMAPVGQLGRDGGEHLTRFTGPSGHAGSASALPRVVAQDRGNAVKQIRRLARAGQLEDASRLHEEISATPAASRNERITTNRASRTIVRRSLGQLFKYSMGMRGDVEGARDALGALARIRKNGGLSPWNRAFAAILRRGSSWQASTLGVMATQSRNIGAASSYLQIAEAMSGKTITSRVLAWRLSRQSMWVARGLAGEKGLGVRALLLRHRDADLESAVAALQISHAAAISAGKSGRPQLEYAQKLASRGARMGAGEATIAAMEFSYPLMMGQRMLATQQMYRDSLSNAEALARNGQGEAAIEAVGLGISLAGNRLEREAILSKGTEALLHIGERLAGQDSEEALAAAAHAAAEAERMAHEDEDNFGPGKTKAGPKAFDPAEPTPVAAPSHHDEAKAPSISQRRVQEEWVTKPLKARLKTLRKRLGEERMKAARARAADEDGDGDTTETGDKLELGRAVGGDATAAP